VNPAGNSEGFDKKMENSNGRGGLQSWKSDGIRGITHFGHSEGRGGGLKHGSHLWYGIDIFWNCPTEPKGTGKKIQQSNAINHLILLDHMEIAKTIQHSIAGVLC